MRLAKLRAIKISSGAHTVARESPLEMGGASMNWSVVVEEEE